MEQSKVDGASTYWMHSGHDCGFSGLDVGAVAVVGGVSRDDENCGRYRDYYFFVGIELKDSTVDGG
jgi:hypothetical protein